VFQFEFFGVDPEFVKPGIGGLSTYGLSGLECDMSTLPLLWTAWHPLAFLSIHFSTYQCGVLHQ